MLQKEKQEVVKILKGHNDEVQSLVWSPVPVSELPGGVFKKHILTAAILLVTFFCRCTYRIITGYLISFVVMYIVFHFGYFSWCLESRVPNVSTAVYSTRNDDSVTYDMLKDLYMIYHVQLATTNIGYPDEKMKNNIAF